MALVIETGEGVAGADSYVTLVDAQAFVDARGHSVTLTEGLLLRAMDALEGLRFKGVKTESSNALSWPRLGFDSSLVMPDEIPSGVVRAQIWLAFHIANSEDPSAVATPAIRMEKVDVLEVEYAVADGAKTGLNAMSFPNVKAALDGLVCYGSGRIDRA